jgi:hypothetical protein
MTETYTNITGKILSDYTLPTDSMFSVHSAFSYLEHDDIHTAIAGLENVIKEIENTFNNFNLYGTYKKIDFYVSITKTEDTPAYVYEGFICYDETGVVRYYYERNTNLNSLGHIGYDKLKSIFPEFL